MHKYTWNYVIKTRLDTKCGAQERPKSNVEQMMLNTKKVKQ